MLRSGMYLFFQGARRAADTDFCSFGAYQKYSMGQLTWKIAGAWAGLVGLFATADYFASQ